MTTMTQPTARPVTTTVLVSLFWLVAATAVAAAHTRLGAYAGAAGAMAAIASAAYCYTRFCAPSAGITHALGVGIAWLVLSMVVELAIAARVHHGWYALFGSPEYPLLRNLSFFVWVFAPAVFARRDHLE